MTSTSTTKIRLGKIKVEMLPKQCRACGKASNRTCRFFITSCAHLYCEVCARRLTPPSAKPGYIMCLAERKPFKIVPLDRTCPVEVRTLFDDIFKVLQRTQIVSKLLLRCVNSAKTMLDRNKTELCHMKEKVNQMKSAPFLFDQSSNQQLQSSAFELDESGPKHDVIKSFFGETLNSKYELRGEQNQDCQRTRHSPCIVNPGNYVEKNVDQTYYHPIYSENEYHPTIPKREVKRQCYGL